MLDTKKEKELRRNMDRTNTRVFLVGSGIASLASAAFLIRDGGILGRNITILEQRERLGGSLDGSGSPADGYVVRGGRMLESKYLCTYDLFSSIPTLDRTKTVTQEIFEWNEILKTGSHARLIRDGLPLNAPKLGLSEFHILGLEALVVASEEALGTTSIAEQMGEDFLKTNFWLMWSTTFAFQPWHSAVEFKRYLARFTHMVKGFNQLHGIMRTVLNQYDSLVLPLTQYLAERGVNFLTSARVENLILNKSHDKDGLVEEIIYTTGKETSNIKIGAHDLVIVTLGSMTECSSLGTNDKAPEFNGKRDGGAWILWENIASGRPEFGQPSAFCEHIDESKWISFTTTLYDPGFLEFVQNLSGNVPGEGGLITLADSSWRCSIVIPAQPHFAGQPEDVAVFWGYGLSVDELGDFVHKTMSECSGQEIFTEILGHLRMSQAQQDETLENSKTIPCMMPFITSQFLRRRYGDRPDVLPKGWKNLAFTGQFCEQPDDVVFTVEYSVRSAANAVYGLLGLDRKPPEVYKGQHNPRILYEAIRSLHDLG